MSTEEPAWKAELMSLLDEHFISSSEEIFDLVAPHIQAAEERGRRGAARALLEHWPYDYYAQECARFLDPESP